MDIALDLSAVCLVVGSIIFIGLTRYWSWKLLWFWSANYLVGLCLALLALHGRRHRGEAALLAVCHGCAAIVILVALWYDSRRSDVNDSMDEEET